MEVSTNYLILLINCKISNQRLDKIILQILASRNFSRNQVQQMIKKGQIILDGQSVSPSTKVRFGQIIIIIFFESRQIKLSSELMNIAVLYEDQYLIVINKAPGVVVYPDIFHTSGTLVNGLLYYYSNLSTISGIFRPGIVHRLDKDTSGALIIAKTNYIHQRLIVAFSSGLIKKEYLAIVWGQPPERGTINVSIGRHPIYRRRMVNFGLNSKRALTYWHLQYSYQSCFSLLIVRSYTGRTHQIRVHLSGAGWPILGDSLYINQLSYKKFITKKNSRIVFAANRQMLHALRLNFYHPITKKRLIITAPLPEDFRTILRLLEHF